MSKKLIEKVLVDYTASKTPMFELSCIFKPTFEEFLNYITYISMSESFVSLNCLSFFWEEKGPHGVEHKSDDYYTSNKKLNLNDFIMRLSSLKLEFYTEEDKESK